MNKALRNLSYQLILLILFAGTVNAQQDDATDRLYYIADYNIEWGAIMDWNAIYQEHSVPILQALVDEGTITAWSAWIHNTGGQYNWRLVIASDDWDSFDDFWDEYLSRFPQEVMEESGVAMTSHRDQIWNANMSKYADNSNETKYAYEALYQIDFSDMEDWTKMSTETEVPVWDKALEDKLITGYVTLGHNTGDHFNAGVVYLFKDWDMMDDFHNRLMSNLMSDAELWKSIGNMMKDHTDVIWERVPDQPQNSN